MRCHSPLLLLALLLMAGPAPAQTPPVQSPPPAAPAADSADKPAAPAAESATKPAAPAAAPADKPAAPAAESGNKPAEATTLPAQPGDPFGDEVTYAERPLLSVKGGAGWENGFETLKKAFRTVNAALAARNLKAAGPPTVIYLRADDAGFDFEAGVPLAETPPAPAVAEEPTVRPTPSGRAFRFTHRGAFESMDRTYDAMTNFLDEKRLDVRELYVEEYLVDPLTTPEDELKVLIYVFPN
jgi:effector-binding domain-containing protein